MEQKNGACGHILKDGRQCAQFTGYMVEPVCRLHHYTDREDVIAFLKRVLDWQREEGSLRGVTRDGRYYPVIWKHDWDCNPPLEKRVVLEADSAFSYLLADGFAYLAHVLEEPEYRNFAERIFKDVFFYQGTGHGPKIETRMVLGYRYYDRCCGTSAKLHAWTGRYCQIMLSMEELAGAESGEPVKPVPDQASQKEIVGSL